MYIDKKMYVQWLEKELKAIKNNSKEDEWIANCPFCDNKENHWDYTINVKKGVSNCWRGFDPRCESGHNILTLVSLYYDISFDKASKFIRKKFQGENSLQRVRKRLKNIGEDRILDISNEKIIWEIPRESISVVDGKTKSSKKVLQWLLKERKIPLKIIEELEPRYLGKNVSRRWQKYKERVFFPVISNGNQAWLAYSMAKKSTKKNPKTKNPPGHILSSMLFMYDYYKDSTESIIINEGLFDAVRFFMFGFNAVCGFGTTVSSEQIELLNLLPSSEVVICYDPDATILKQNDKGKWTCRAYRVAEDLKKHYFGDVSVMKLKREDPDRSTYQEAKIAFKNRERFGKRLWRIKKLQADNLSGKEK